MDRRSFLVGLAAASGCLGRVAPPRAGGGDARDGGARNVGDAGEPTVAAPGIAVHGYPSSICETEIVEDFAISAIVGPAFADGWPGRGIDERYGESGLTDDTVVIGVERASVRGGADGAGHDGNGDRGGSSDDAPTARAYPLPVVWWHEIVNETFGGPLLVTYCPICRSGLVAERLVDGEPTLFGVSGQLWQPPLLYTEASEHEGRTFAAQRGNASGDIGVRNSGNLVMYDEATRSYWSQLLGRAICGPQTGEELAVVPATVTTWGDWRAAHPDTDVLLPPPYSETM